MDPLPLVDLLNELPDLCQGIGKLFVFREIHLLFLDRAHQPLGIAVLLGVALRRHTDLDIVLPQQADVIPRGVLHPLVIVVNGWDMIAQGPAQRDQRQFLIEPSA